MPRFSVLAIKASLVYLGIGFTFGALMLFNKGVPILPLLWGLLPAHIEILIFGWILQLGLGVAFWILPRFGTGSRRGNEKIAWVSLCLLNLGVLSIVFASWLNPGSLQRWMQTAGRLAEVGAAVAFAMHAWKRIKATGA